MNEVIREAFIQDPRGRCRWPPWPAEFRDTTQEARSICAHIDPVIVQWPRRSRSSAERTASFRPREELLLEHKRNSLAVSLGIPGILEAAKQIMSLLHAVYEEMSGGRGGLSPSQEDIQVTLASARSRQRMPRTEVAMKTREFA